MSDDLDFQDLHPDDTEGHARLLQHVLLRACEGCRTADYDGAYVELRRRMMRDLMLKPLLPSFVREHRDLGHLWPYFKNFDPQWEPRRQHVRDALTPLFNHIERIGAAPVDAVAFELLQSFGLEAVHAVWEKALARRYTDPEGAITSARTLLETVCKHILDGMDVTYSEKADLPALMKLTAEQLSLAPNQHSEDAFKRILGGAANVVEGLGSLRNKIGDAHGRGRRQVKPSPRHAQLAVNMAGAAATFLVETWEKRLEEFLEDFEDSKGG
jgi:abortive infection Abi-like protein